MEALQMDSLTGIFDQFVSRFGPPTTYEENKTTLGVCVLASWVLVDGTRLFLDEGDSVANRLGPYRTAFLKIFPFGEQLTAESD
jgi:hypothetical protein